MTKKDAHEFLTVFDEPRRELQLLAKYVASLGALRGELSILEAGCGNSWQLDLQGVPYVLTGIDVCEDALAIRRNKLGDLDRIIVGDIRTANLEADQYDVIYNSFVLEHLDQVERVLDNFERWVRPGGLLILRIPDRESVYGFLAQRTPFWFHVFYKRYIAGIKTAGKPGYDPFPTVYEPIVSRQGIRRWCVERGLTVREEIAWNYNVGRSGVASVLIRGTIKGIGVLSGGRLAASHVNLSYVIEKPAAPVSASNGLTPS